MPDNYWKEVDLRLNKAGLPLLSRCCCFGRSCLLRPDRRAGVSEGRRQGGLAASPDSCAGQHRWRSGRALRARLIGACVLVAVAGLPGTSAGLAPPQQSGDQFEVRRLAEVREGLERRRQLQRSLQGQVDELARKIDDLRVQLEYVHPTAVGAPGGAGSRAAAGSTRATLSRTHGRGSGASGAGSTGTR